MLKGDGKGNFKPLSILQSGIYIPGNGKALVQIRGKNGDLLLAASQNKDSLKVFKLNKPIKSIQLKPTDAYALLKYNNGKTGKEEFYYGSSFLSQSSRFMKLDDDMVSVVIYDDNGKSRVIK
jgi:hypothetical protein